MKQNKHIQNILENLPDSPGIYQFFNIKEEIIYVGKSKKLKDRVNSYFQKGNTLSPAKSIMVRQIIDIKIILTNNETESLILERSLIGKYKPQYNILLKDDKNYLYIKITDEVFPKIIKTRIKNNSGSYFGPFTSGSYVTNVLKLLKKYFGYGAFGISFFDDTKKYSLDPYIFQNNLSAKSKKEGISPEEIQKFYNEKIQEIKTFLKGDTHTLIEILKEKMLLAAKNLEFEQATKLREDIKSLEMTQEEQIVRDFVKGNFDVVQVLEKYENYYLGVIEIRDSVITGFFSHEIQNKLEENSQNILKNYLEEKFVQYLESGEKVTFILSENPSEINTGIHFEVPQKGGKLDILKLCYKNTYNFAHKKYLASLSTKSFSKQTMKSLLEILGYKRINKDIIFECNDISHLSGNYTVASRSIIENGKKNPNKYRKYKIQNLQEGEINDFDSMREVISRRLKEAIKLGSIPDLIIIDGGKGQLSSVIQIQKYFLENMEIVLEEIFGKNFKDEISLDIAKERIENIQFVSLAKREEELFLPGKSESILLTKDSSELRLVQAIRDEAHRFAITFNRNSRSKAQKKNILESLPGIGPVTRKKILRHFSSLQKLSESSHEEIQNILGKKVFDILESHGLI